MRRTGLLGVLGFSLSLAASACVPFKSQSADGSAAAGTGGELDGASPEASPSDGTNGRPLGAACSSDGGCASGHCADGVCCSTACSEQCHACKTVLTGRSDGTCALVRAGVPHGDDCSMTAPTSCGTDGTCDGAGSCRKWGTDTTCGPSSCTTGSSSFVSAATCDGNGTCKPGIPSSCGAYRCGDDNRTCDADCSAGADCSPGAYCDGGKCFLWKKDGAICAGTVECASGTCGGRCCPKEYRSCMCPQPSAGNVVRNGGFDNDLSGWTIEPNDGEVVWVPSDVTDCPYSGSMKLSLPAGASLSPRISQCVATAGGELHAQIKAKCLPPFNVLNCSMDVFAEPRCVGTAMNMGRPQWFNQDWGLIPGDLSVPAGGSMRVSCFLEPNQTDAAAALIDMVGLTPPPAQY